MINYVNDWLSGKRLERMQVLTSDPKSVPD